MGWMHSLLGGALGFAIAGPLGAVVGAALGHGLGQRGAANAQLEGQERAQAAFFVSTFSMLAKMARADGRVSEEEIAVAQRFMRHELGLDTEAERFAVIAEEAVAKGVRRLTALTGHAARVAHEEAERLLERTRQLDQAPPEELHAAVDELNREINETTLPLVQRRELQSRLNDSSSTARPRATRLRRPPSIRPATSPSPTPRACWSPRSTTSTPRPSARRWT
jgi:hypothetical protein